MNYLAKRICLAILGISLGIYLTAVGVAQPPASNAQPAPVYTPDGQIDPGVRYADLTITNDYDAASGYGDEQPFVGDAYPYQHGYGDVGYQQQAPLEGIPRRKEGFLQMVEVSEAYLPASDDADLGLHEIMAWFSVAVPFPIKEAPLVISPTFGLTLLDGPNTTPLPEQLYRNSIDFMWMPEMGNWKLSVAATPGYYSDYEASDDNALRIPGRLIVTRSFLDGTLDLMGGIAYLDREDIDFLPVAGLRYRPNANWDLAVVFPRPKLAYRFNWDGVREDWIYLGGEFGGNTWAVQTPGIGDDLLTLADLRLQLGWERRTLGGIGVGAEIAYVFDRSFELASAVGAVDLNDAVMVRGVLRY